MRKTLKSTYWIKNRFSKNKLVRRNINSKKQVLRQFFFCLWYIQFLKFTKIVWYKHNLIISSVGSDHPDQYSYVIPHKYLSGWENLSEKIISTKHKHYFLIAYVLTFFLFLQSIYFFGGVLFPEQSLLCGSYFFQNSYFFRAKFLPSSFLGQLLCRNSYFFNEGTCSK